MDSETFARALCRALRAEGVDVDDADLARVRIDGEVDLLAVARRLRPAAARPRRPSPLDQPPAWLRAYP